MKKATIDLSGWEKTSLEQQKKFKNFLEKCSLKKVLPVIAELETEAYEKINCLDCAHCCKNYSPRFKVTDIKRISKTLKMKESDFIEQYLTLDEEGDFVSKGLPCPFLEENNQCRIYEDRPGDCKRFPYAGEDVFVKRKKITLKNITFCPIAYFVIASLTEKLPLPHK